MADGEGHGDNGEPERQRDPEKTYSHVWKRSGNYGAPASAQNQPKCTDELGGKLPRERHDDSLSFWRLYVLPFAVRQGRLQK
jgi:hypothetical protein